MKLEQLRILCALVDQDLNMSRTAEALHTSQPSISKKIKLLEAELATPLICRGSHRITGLTPFGAHIVEIARQVLDDVERIAAFGRESKEGRTKRVTMITTHLHASYVFPPLLARFRETFPDVKIVLHNGEPSEIYGAVARGHVNLGVTTTLPKGNWHVLPIPSYHIGRTLILPVGHPLSKRKDITVEDIARYPLVTYCESFAGSMAITRTFDRLGLPVNIVIRTMDTESIKKYVRLGLGIAVVHSVAIDNVSELDAKLTAIDVSPLFGYATAYVVLRPTVRMPEHFWHLVELLAPSWERQKIFAAIENLRRKAHDNETVM